MAEHFDRPLSIIVVSYNTRELTLECLRSVFRQTRVTDFELIVVDNASTDGSAAAIQAEFGRLVRLIASKDNLGFAAGNNLAAQEARGQYLLLLNPDTVVLDNAVGRLLAFAEENPAAGIWGGRTLFGDGTLNPASCWSRQTLWSLVSQAIGLSSLWRKRTLCNPEGIGSWDRRGERYVDIVSGCFLMIRHDFWRHLGGFREAFFMYGEEADLCLRARREGATPMVSGAATIIHYGGASETVYADKIVRLLRAKMLLITTHFQPVRAVLGLWLLTLWPLSRYCAHALLATLGRGRSEGPRKVWREVWKRRAEWQSLTPMLSQPG